MIKKLLVDFFIISGSFDYFNIDLTQPKSCLWCNATTSKCR